MANQIEENSSSKSSAKRVCDGADLWSNWCTTTTATANWGGLTAVAVQFAELKVNIYRNDIFHLILSLITYANKHVISIMTTRADQAVFRVLLLRPVLVSRTHNLSSSWLSVHKTMCKLKFGLRLHRLGCCWKKVNKIKVKHTNRRTRLTPAPVPTLPSLLLVRVKSSLVSTYYYYHY